MSIDNYKEFIKTMQKPQLAPKEEEKKAAVKRDHPQV